MKILLDEDNYIIGYATVGDIVGSIEFKGAIPEDYEAGIYKYEKGKIIKDEVKVNKLKKEKEDKLKEEQLYQQFLKEHFEDWKNNK